ncbi:MAG: DUF2752 domain-containing protein [Pyrinomonadaceae bacterium]|nr:DUF2752 domain-containing protein [Pyrinomonadaceae bacterium]
MEPKFSTSERSFAGAGLVLLTGGCFVVGIFNPSTAGFFPGCPLLDLTGYACPGCGLTRAFHALFHGDFIAALDFNAIIPFFVIGFVYLAILLASIMFRGKGLPYTFFSPSALTVFGVIAVTFGIIRNIPAYPFEILFP